MLRGGWMAGGYDAPSLRCTGGGSAVRPLRDRLVRADPGGLVGTGHDT